MKIRAIDIGTNLGWADLGDDGTVSAGTLLLASDTNLRQAKKLRFDRRLDIRVQALVNWLWNSVVPERIVFEDVRFCSSQAQGHLYGSLRGVIWTYAHRKGIQIDCLDTGKLKVFTTGAGNATKEMMATAAAKRWPWLNTDRLDDNGVDAVCLLQWARVTYGIK